MANQRKQSSTDGRAQNNMKNWISQNWLWKLLSVICAIALWITIYTINDPQETKYLSNVPVTFKNTEAITDNGQLYEVLDKTDVLRSIKLVGSRSVLNDIKETDINVVADFTKMKLDNTVEISITSIRHNDDITFTPSRKEVLLKVENNVERSFPVEIQYVGDMKKGYIIDASTLTPNRITISGAESYVNNVSKVVAGVDVSNASGDLFSHAEITLYDKDDKVIEADGTMLKVHTKQVNATVEVLATKTVPVKYVPSGTTVDGFVAVSEVLSDVTELTIAGKESALSAINEIVVSGDALEYENAEANVQLSVDLDNYLPEGVARADKRGSGIVSVTVQISPVVEKEYTLKTSQIAIENIPEEYSVKYVYEKAEIVVTLHGAEYLLNKITETDMVGKVDITAWMETRNMNSFEHGSTHKIVPDFELEEGIAVLNAEPIEVIANKLED